MEPQPVVLRSHYDAAGTVERIEVLDAPALSMISAELLATMDPIYLAGNILVLAPDVRYLIGAECNDHGDRLLHRIT